jgi:hypothetical protein
MTAESQNLTGRPLAVSDAAAMADLLNAVDAQDRVWGQYTVEEAADELESPIVDLPTSTLAVFDGRPPRRCTRGTTPRSDWSSNPCMASMCTGQSPCTVRQA